MAAYAALVSLRKTIPQIKSDQVSFHPLVKATDFLVAIFQDDPDELNNFEDQIRDEANRAKDIIEHFMSTEFLSSNNPRSTKNAGSAHNQSGFLKVSEQLQDVAGKIGAIADEVPKIEKSKNSLRTKDIQLGDSSSTSSASSLAPTSKDTMVGFEEDLLKIKTRLDEYSTERTVIPIVGMGGIGKTTLARNVYNDPSITEKFDIRVWMTVSQNYDADEIFLSILVCMKEFERKLIVKGNEEIPVHIHKFFLVRRYLIVMEDIWSENAWNDIAKKIPDNGFRSRIIVTTRLSEVATYAAPHSRHHVMCFMDEHQSWNLLHNKVFSNGSCPPELESTGKVIAKGCRGLPLAVVVTAGLLSAVDQTPDSWKIIANKLTGTIEDEHIEEILSLSYTNLPHYLRPCFLYMGAFLKDHEINVSKLIKLWVAEGFLEPIGSKSLEEWAEECLENLVKRNLVLVTKRKSNGKIKSYSLHDLVRDMCISKSKKEMFLQNVHLHTIPTESVSNQHRRLSVSSDLDWFKDINLSIIQTIIYYQTGSRLLVNLEKFELLWVLDALKAKFDSFPEEVTHLFHLRYLAFSSKYETISISRFISKLQNLQTLMVRSERRFVIQPNRVSLPEEIWNMPNLRHLVSFVFRPLPNPPVGTSSLVNLQTLSVVTNLKCNEEILKMIPNLKKLGIFYDGERENWPDYQLNNLVNLSRLEKLSITVENSRSLLEELVFPENLKKLTLRGCIISWENFGNVSWPNLQVLKLRSHACEGDKWETTEENFPELKVLMIESRNLQIWETESSHFPVLETLLLYGCEKLKKVPEDFRCLMTLELIEVDGTNRDLLESANWIREEQESDGNFGLQVRSYHA